MQTKSFTLIEIIITITMVSILSFFVIVQANSAVNAGRDSKRKLDISLLSNAIVSYSNDNYYTKPITDADGCTINGDCPSSVSEALSPYLSNLPSDPDGTNKYVYQSNGSDCTVSATLSNGTVYQYACESNANTEGTPTPGACGSAAIAYDPGTTTFAGTYCNSGRIDSTPTFPETDGTYVTWNCLGEYLGSSTPCTAYRGQDGTCGTTANTTLTALAPMASFPSDNYCATGTVSSVPSDPIQGGSTIWTCSPLYAGDTTTCTTYRGKDGICGTSIGGNYYTSSEITNTCTSGTASAITGSGSVPYINYWSWTCPPIYNGNSASCTANLKVNGSCGLANGNYYSEVPAANIRCGNGVPSNTTSWSWTCSGYNTGNPSGTCIAYQRQACTNWTTCGTTPCCKFSGSTCPTGWTSAGYTTTTSTVPGNCAAENGVCVSGSGGNPQEYIYACGLQACHCPGSHTFGPQPVEYAWYYNWCIPGTFYGYATITEVGCY